MVRSAVVVLMVGPSRHSRVPMVAVRSPSTIASTRKTSSMRAFAPLNCPPPQRWPKRASLPRSPLPRVRRSPDNHLAGQGDLNADRVPPAAIENDCFRQAPCQALNIRLLRFKKLSLFRIVAIVEPRTTHDGAPSSSSRTVYLIKFTRPLLSLPAVQVNV